MARPSRYMMMATLERENERLQAKAALCDELVEAAKLALEFFVAWDIENKVVSGLSLQLHEVLTKAEALKKEA